MKSFREFRQTHSVDEGIVLQTLPVAARSMQGQRAGFFTRVIAAVIDVVIVGAIVLGVWVAAWLFLLVFNPFAGAGLPQPGYFLVGGTVVLWAYWTWTWATSGRSPGQSLMGVRVLDRDENHPSWGLAAVRSAFCVVFQVGLLWTLVSRRNRSVQDVVLRTSVIHDWTTSSRSGAVAPLDAQTSAFADAKSSIDEKASRIADGIDSKLHRRSDHLDRSSREVP